MTNIVMQLIVGLGNPGEKYKNNRHNVGFMFIDYLVHGCQLSVVSQKPNTYTHSYLYQVFLNKPATNNQQQATIDIVLAKPTTYMNKSGVAVKKLVNTYLTTNNQEPTTRNQQPGTNNQSLIANNLIVVHDDLDIPFGKFRIVKGYGPKLHNGIESIQNHLHTMDFLRIRIGVDNRIVENRIPGIDYVLRDFTHEEMVQIPIIFDQIKERLRIEKIAIF